MAMELVTLSERELAAAREFNARMRAANAPSNFIAEELTPNPNVLLRRTEFVAWDGAAVRGGMAQVEYPAWLNGSAVTAMNFQAHVSEGVIDKKYALVGALLVQYTRRRAAIAFGVGMGDLQNPITQMLKSAAWRLQTVPFLFRVHRAGRFLTGLRMIQKRATLAMLAAIAARTGAGTAAFGLLAGRGALGRLRLGGYSIEPMGEWEDWSDEVWESFRPSCSFAVIRNSPSLNEMYPSSDERILRFVIRRNGRPAGWSACFHTGMRDHDHFGNLRVATILDAVARPEAMAPTVALTDRALGELGADLVISNQSHHLWRRAFRQSGFVSGPSNYVFGKSPALSSAIAAQPDGNKRVHVTRGDGDGRVNL